MSSLQLNSVLRIGRVLLALLIATVLVGALSLFVVSTKVAAGKPEVRLTLNTTRPNLFPAFNELLADLKGTKPHHSGHITLSALPTRATGFNITADSKALFLRYEEPSAWKRLALLHLGASNSDLSLAWVLFFGVCSWLLYKLLQDAKLGTPFTLANAYRLRNMGLLIIGPIYFGESFSYFALRALIPDFHTPELSEPLSHYVRLNTAANLPGLQIGLMLLVIAAMYQRGVQLSQEAELVI